MLALGLMSGTSMDGIDLALLDTDGRDRLRFGPTAFAPYAEADRALLRRALADAVGLRDRGARPGALAEAEARITALHAAAGGTSSPRTRRKRASWRSSASTARPCCTGRSGA